MFMKGQAYKIIVSILLTGAFLILVWGSGDSKAKSSQTIVVDDWSNQQSVIKAMQGKWHGSGTFTNVSGDIPKSVEMIITINGNSINVSSNVEGRGYKDWDRPGEVFFFDKVEEFHPCSKMKETDHTKRYKFSIKNGGDLMVTNADGDCEPFFYYNSDFQLTRYP
jgi:hypothetical protein